MSKIINAAGLFLNIVGVVIVFRWGPPQPSFDRTIGLAIEGPQADAQAVQAANNETHYRHLSQAGLILVIVGFALQFAAVWLPND